MKRPYAVFAARIFGSKPEGRLALMKAAWPAAVGAELANRTEVVALDGDLLRVRVPDATWQRALARMRGDLLRRLREIVGAAAPRSLGFVEGAVRPTEPATVAQAAVAETKPPASLVAAADSIADAQLRELFLASSARYLTRFSGR